MDQKIVDEMKARLAELTAREQKSEQRSIEAKKRDKEHYKRWCELIDLRLISSDNQSISK